MNVKELYKALDEVDVAQVNNGFELEKTNIKLAFVFSHNGELYASHKEIEGFKEVIKKSKGFDNHEAVFIGRYVHPEQDEEKEFKTVFLAFVHNTNRGLSQGGLRLREYSEAKDGGLTDLEVAVEDGLRLARGMTRKNAISDLWWGGGKAVIPVTKELFTDTFRKQRAFYEGNGKSLDDQTTRRKIRDGLFEAYGEFIALLNGVYYTAADMNTYNDDMQAVLKNNRFVTCVPRKLGGSGDPSPHTAEGVFRAIKTTVDFMNEFSGLKGVKVAVQGAGKVGEPLIRYLLSEGAEVCVSDTRFEDKDLELRAAKINKFKQGEFENVEVIPCGEGHENDIFSQDVQIIAPCAAGGVINKYTIKLFQPGVKIICGGANNILGDEEIDGETLFDLGIVYIPDFLCNWMGIVNCANEPFGYLESDIEKSLDRVPETVKNVLERAGNKSHMQVANEIADEKFELLNKQGELISEKNLPQDELRRYRGRQIMNKLIEDYAAQPIPPFPYPGSKKDNK